MENNYSFGPHIIYKQLHFSHSSIKLHDLIDNFTSAMIKTHLFNNTTTKRILFPCRISRLILISYDKLSLLSSLTKIRNSEVFIIIFLVVQNLVSWFLVIWHVELGLSVRGGVDRLWCRKLRNFGSFITKNAIVTQPLERSEFHWFFLHTNEIRFQYL